MSFADVSVSISIFTLSDFADSFGSGFNINCLTDDEFDNVLMAVGSDFVSDLVSCCGLGFEIGSTHFFAYNVVEDDFGVGFGFVDL